MSHGHYIEKCRYCMKVISQCRCIDIGKAVILGVCPTCKPCPECRGVISGPYKFYRNGKLTYSMYCGSCQGTGVERSEGDE